MALTIATCLKLAEAARCDASLLPNHKGTVDRMLTDKLDAEKFSFIRALKQVGYKEPPKKEKPTS